MRGKAALKLARGNLDSEAIRKVHGRVVESGLVMLPDQLFTDKAGNPNLAMEQT